MSTITSTFSSTMTTPLTTSLSVSNTTSFPPFPRLPLEVREMIWQLAFHSTQSPRLIEVSATTEENLFWDVDCENITYPKPTASRVVRWSETTPRQTSPSPLETVCKESRDVVEREWDWCFGDTHDASTSMMELDPEKETVRYLDDEEVEKKLGVSFKKGIRFLSDLDRIYIKAGHGVLGGLRDARASTLKLGNIRNVALDSYWTRHYLIGKQLFDGWAADDEFEMGEEPMLKGLRDLVVVIHNFGNHVGPVEKVYRAKRAGICKVKELVDEEAERAHLIMADRLGGMEVIKNGDVKMQILKERELESQPC